MSYLRAGCRETLTFLVGVFVFIGESQLSLFAKRPNFTDLFFFPQGKKYFFALPNYARLNQLLRLLRRCSPAGDTCRRHLASLKKKKFPRLADFEYVLFDALKLMRINH